MTSAPSSVRRNPFHMGLPEGEWMQGRIDAILDEARVRGTVLEDPSSFLLLAQVGASLQDLRPDAAAAPLGEGPQDAIRQELFHSFGMFFFQAFHLLRPTSDAAHGVGDAPGDSTETATGPGPERPPRGIVVEVGDGAALDLVAAAQPAAARPWALPSDSGYVVLPANRFWTRPQGTEAPAEALDGIGWVLRRGAPDALAVMAIGGVIPGRPGFSVLPIPPVPARDAPGWIRDPARPPELGEDFAPNLPGAELSGLYGVETAGEILKLLARSIGLACEGRATVRPFPAIPSIAPLLGDPDSSDRSPPPGAPPPGANADSEEALPDAP
jgi:hypothetical protein